MTPPVVNAKRSLITPPFGFANREVDSVILRLGIVAFAFVILWIAHPKTARAEVLLPEHGTFRNFVREVDSALVNKDIASLLKYTDSSVAWPLNSTQLAVPSLSELETLMTTIVPADSRITHLQSDIPPVANRAFFLTNPGTLFWVAESRRRHSETNLGTWRIVLVKRLKEFPIFFDLRSLAEVDFRTQGLVRNTAQREQMAFLDHQGLVHVVSLPEGREEVYGHPSGETYHARIVGWGPRESVVLESTTATEPWLWMLKPSTETWTSLGLGRNATVSPDGRWLIYELPRRSIVGFDTTGPVALRDLTRLGRPPRVLDRLRFSDPVGWRRDGVEVLVGASVVTAANGRIRPSPFESLPIPSLSRTPLPCFYAPSWSPDQSQLAAVVPAAESPGTAYVLVAPARGGAVRRLASIQTDPTQRSCRRRQSLPWLADGSAVHFDAGGAIGQVIVPLSGEQAIRLGIDGAANPGQSPRLGRVADLSLDGVAVHLVPTQWGSLQTLGVGAGPRALPRKLARGFYETANFSPSGRWLVTVELVLEHFPRRWWAVRDVDTGLLLWRSTKPNLAPIAWWLEAPSSTSTVQTR